ncbi:hypothetical protein NE686_17510 [Tissierella carlieri]|uniref:Uncharacterized protein n=1 Tax=Tissierella carlieri TaxID=689904 RepID=A0ABT1SEJ6_9FIRM|nr:hypothetical protein [Tissierella carlieri]MCQ4924903.1 hypothetical protein [Tissierella carlieri]
MNKEELKIIVRECLEEMRAEELEIKDREENKILKRQAYKIKIFAIISFLVGIAYEIYLYVSGQFNNYFSQAIAIIFFILGLGALLSILIVNLNRKMIQLEEKNRVIR